LQLGDAVHAFVRGGEAAFQNARSPNSRGRLSLNFDNRTRNEAPKTDEGSPRPKNPKKIQKKKKIQKVQIEKKKKKKENKRKKDAHKK
jgi:hypothetical protein